MSRPRSTMSAHGQGQPRRPFREIAGISAQLHLGRRFVHHVTDREMFLAQVLGGKISGGGGDSAANAFP